MASEFPRYIVWSTDRIDTSDSFQRRWLLRQALMHGLAEDIRKLNLNEVERELDSFSLPAKVTQAYHAGASVQDCSLPWR
ncbi:MAG: hypothetical protein ACUVWR_06120 [Anaerolineae bacterium]